VVTFDAQIVTVELLPDNMIQIDFVSPGELGDFHLESTSDVSAGWNEETTAVLSALPGGYRFRVSRDGDTRFYRIRR
jgi:hypothetical protein